MTTKHNMTIHPLIWTLFIVLSFGFSTDSYAKKVEYTKMAGKIKSCPVIYPENSKRSAAQYNVAKKGCWSCPKGYERSKNPLPDKKSSCKKKNVTKFAKKSNVEVKWGACKGKDVWKRDKKCWTCPDGYKRSLKMKDGKPVCKPDKKYSYAKAKKRGEAKRACPAGFIRNPDSDKKKNACMRLNVASGQRSVSNNAALNLVQNKINEASNLIDLLDRFKQRLDPVIKRKGIKNVTKRDLRKAGAIDIINRGCDGREHEQYGSYTITVGGDGAYVLGGNASGGIAFGRIDGCETGKSDNPNETTDWNMTWLATANVSAGASIGVDGSIQVGFWKPRFDDLHGYAWGLVGGGALGPAGVTASGWMGIDWKPGRKGEFLGVSLGYQGGLSAEGEVNWGYTFQKQTFNSCKDVTVHAVNKTGKDIKIIDVDYHDYYKKVWRSEPTPNRKISANGKPYIWKFNLNQVDHAYTQIRVKYRKKKSGGGWTSEVFRDWSGKSLCERGKKYKVNLEL